MSRSSEILSVTIGFLAAAMFLCLLCVMHPLLGGAAASAAVAIFALGFRTWVAICLYGVAGVGEKKRQQRESMLSSAEEDRQP